MKKQRKKELIHSTKKMLKRLLRIDSGTIIDARKRKDPIYAIKTTNKSVLVNACTAKCRGWFSFPLSQDSEHPYIKAVAASQTGCAEMHEILSVYFERVQPNSLPEWLDMPPDASEPLDSIPPWAVALPWETESPEDRKTSLARLAYLESQNQGLELTIDEGWSAFGPVSEKKLQMETDRLRQISKSLEAKGYQRHNGWDGDVEATALVREDGEWRWIIMRGQHRAAVAAGLGFTSIPIRVTNVVNRREAEHWPNVRRGFYTESSGRELFDRLFDGIPPEVAKRWEKDLLS